MNALTRFPLAALAVSLVTACASGATRITNIVAEASSKYANRDPLYAVNGAGLYGSQHTNTADFVSWMSATQPTTVSGVWFRVDLGQVTPLSHFKLWNFNFWHATVATTNRGIKDAEVYLSSLGSAPGSDFTNTSQWTRVIDKVTFGKAPGSNAYAGEPDVSLAGLQARWIALRVLTNYSATDFTAGISELQVFAAERPIVVTATPTVTDATRATLPGTLTFDGGFAATVFAYWGTTDGGTVSSAWDHAVCLGVLPVGAFSTNVAVAADAQYAFRMQAVTAGGAGWSDPGAFITAPVSVEMPASVSEGSGAVPVTFRRPSALTNAAVTINFSIAGSAVAGSDYVLPATSVVVQAGADTAATQIPLIDDLTLETNETLTVGIGPSACAVAAGSTNSTVITDDDGPLSTIDWSRHMTVTLTNYTGSSTLTNFPCVLRLSEQIPGFRYADFSQSNGGDLRITDGATGETLLYEIESWDPAGTSIVWVCVSTLSGASTALKLHWNNKHAVLPGYATGGLAWGSDFGGVWHLREANALDSTPNRNHGMAYGNATAPGVLGSAQYFRGTDHVQVPDSAAIGTQTVDRLTISLWFKSDETLMRTNENWRLLEKGDDYFFGQGYGSGGGMVLILKKNNSPSSVGNNADIASNEWHYACGTYDNATMRLYIDGVFKGSSALAGPIDDDKLPLWIGADDSGKFFKGALDEARVEHVVRSADWVRACFDSQKANAAFAGFGAVTRTMKGTLINVF